MKTYKRKWYGSGGENPIFTAATVENGVVTDAWVYQIGGNFISSGGAEGCVLGKTEAEIIADGFQLHNPFRKHNR